jgi:hypothetical protein
VTPKEARQKLNAMMPLPGYASDEQKIARAAEREKLYRILYAWQDERPSVGEPAYWTSPPDDDGPEAA